MQTDENLMTGGNYMIVENINALKIIWLSNYGMIMHISIPSISSTKFLATSCPDFYDKALSEGLAYSFFSSSF